MSLADLRQSYERGALSLSDVLPDPIHQFERWFQEALAEKVAEANAMTLATVGADGRPSSRIVLLKGLDLGEAPEGATGRGFVWYTNYQSRKGVELAIHPFAALQFHWVALERQVRIEGRVERTSGRESDAYFAARPLGSQIGAWASPQSTVVPDRLALEKSEAQFAERFGTEVPRPQHWGGFRLVPDRLEFWQGRPSRLHDRIRYTRGAGGPPEGHWETVRLAP